MSFNFQNSNSQQYELRLGVSELEQVRDKLGINFFKLEDIANLNEDIPKLCRAFWLVSMPVNLYQTAEREDYETFSAGMDGDALEDAGNALTKALLKLLPSSKSDMLETVMGRVEEFQTIADQQVDEMLAAYLGTA